MTRSITVFILVFLVGLNYSSGQTAVAYAPHSNGAYEKIYVHTDKEFYMPGEIMWFKVYVVDALSLRPSDISHVAYIDVLNGDNASVLQTKVELGVSKANNGSLYIPNDMPSGIYRVTAYTHLMKNLGPESFYTKQITLQNPFLDGDQIVREEGIRDHVLRLYPESGVLLDGVATRIGYKLVGNNGKGTRFEALVLENDSVEVARVTANQYGMGSFSFTPKLGKQYTMRAAVERGDTVNASFPAIEKEGYLFNVLNNEKSRLDIAISASQNYANKSVSLQVRSQEHIICTIDAHLDDESKATAFIEKVLLPDGVICLTLLDDHDHPVAERLVFQYPERRLDIATSLNTETINKRDGIELFIKSSVGGRPTASDLSVSVYKVHPLQGLPTDDIRSYLWLQSEVSGHIEDIEYYFSDTEQNQLERDMDNMLLTQGWRKINLKYDEGYIVEYKSHRITLRYTDKVSDRPLVGEQVFLSVPGKHNKLYLGETDSNGIAMFNVKGIYGTTQLATTLASNQESNVELLSPFYTSHLLIDTAKYEKNFAAFKTDILRHSINVQVENAYLKRQRAQYLAPKVDTIPFYGSADKTYWLDDYTRFVVMEEVLREYVPEISVRKRQTDFGLRVLDRLNRVYFMTNPLMILDGVPLLNANEIMYYDPLKVEKMDIVNTKYFHGSLTYDGVVSFSTYNGVLEGFELNPSTTLLNYEGLQYEREFYTPVYDTKEQRESRMPDMRNVLLWKPNLKLDDTGETVLIINTSDLSGDYAIVVQGLDDQGNVGNRITRFTVR